MTPRAVRFDLDGTLVDSLPAIAEAMSEALRRNGYAVSPETIRPLIGAPMHILAGQITGTLPTVAARMNADYLELYHRDFIDQTESREGASGLIERLRSAGLLLAVVTNKTAEGGRLMLRIQGWTDAFAVVHGREDSPAPKPSPEAALAALRALGVRAVEAAFVGDTEFDMSCARDAGIPLIVGITGARESQQLLASGATHVVSHLDQVGALLLGAEVQA